jgi:hypothetical protein
MSCYVCFNPLNAELNPNCHLLALLEAHPILHISRIRVKELQCFHHWCQHFVWDCVTTKDKGSTIFQNTMTTTHPMTERRIPEDLNIQQHCCQNIKSHKQTSKFYDSFLTVYEQ